MVVQRFIVLLIALYSLMSSFLLSAAEKPSLMIRTVVYVDSSIAEIDAALTKLTPSHFSLVDTLPVQTVDPVYTVDTLQRSDNEFIRLTRQYLTTFGKGLTSSNLNHFHDSNRAVVIDAAYPDTQMAFGLKSIIRFAFDLAISLDGLIWDGESREIFSLEAWKQSRLEGWQGELPLVSDHILIFAHNNQGQLRSVTRGMAKFGYPDILVSQFSEHLSREVGNLMNLVSQLIIEGGRPNRSGLMPISIADLRDTAYKRELVSSLRRYTESHVLLQLRQGTRVDGDPNNYLLEVSFENAVGDNLEEKQERFLTALFLNSKEYQYSKRN